MDIIKRTGLLSPGSMYDSPDNNASTTNGPPDKEIRGGE